jgi:hypothetical protein
MARRRSAAAVEEEFAAFRREHTKDVRGFKDIAHGRVDAFHRQAQELLAAGVDAFLSSPELLLSGSHPSAPLIVQLATFASDQFAETLHAQIDADTQDAFGRAWSTISLAEYEAKARKLEAELEDIEKAGRLEEAKRVEAEAAAERKRLQAELAGQEVANA